MVSGVIVGLPEWSVDSPCTFAGHLVRALTANGIDARVLLTQTNKALANTVPTSIARDSGFPVDLLPASYNDTEEVRRVALVHYLEERSPCCYLMLHDWCNNIVAARMADGVRIILVVQADRESEYVQAMRIGEYCNAIVATNDLIHHSLVHAAPRITPRVVTIPDAVPALQIVPERTSTGPLRILHSGLTYDGNDRFEDLIPIARGLNANKVPFVLTVIANCEAREDVKAQGRDLVAGGLLKFVEPLGNSDLLKELSSQDVYLQTSASQPYLTPLLEAMSRGCVPVVSDLAIQSLIIQHGVNSYRTPIGGVSTFINYLTELANSPVSRSQMAQAAFQTVTEKYTVENMADSYVSLFTRIEAMSSQRRYVRPRRNEATP